MDKGALLDRLGAAGEDRLILAKILDRAEQARGRNIPAATDFLSPAQLAQWGRMEETAFQSVAASNFQKNYRERLNRRKEKAVAACLGRGGATAGLPGGEDAFALGDGGRGLGQEGGEQA